MELIVHRQGVYFCGQVKDILNLWQDYPLSLTLSEFIRLNLA
jgi:hypothetical protein